MFSAQTQVLLSVVHMLSTLRQDTFERSHWKPFGKFNIVFPKDCCNTVRRCRDTHLKPVSILFNIVLSVKPCIYCKGPQDLQALELGMTDQSEVWM